MALRFKNNPIIKPDIVKPSLNNFKVVSTINAGATTFDNEIILLIRVAERPDYIKLNKNYNNHFNKNKINLKNFVYTATFDIKDKKFKILKFDKNDPDLTLLDSRGIKYKDKTYLSSISHLRIATSKDGINLKISDTPTIVPDNIFEEYGIEDPRITKLNFNNKTIYLITYTSVSRYGITVSLMETEDFVNFKRHGVILPPDNKDVTIFPDKINGFYYMLHRPMKSSFYPPSIWISKSTNYRYWGNHKFLIGPRKNFFDSSRIGGGDTPVLIDEGWITIYHGVDNKGKYHLGALLLDKNNPEIVLKRSKIPILSPETDYEKNGFYGNVVFTCGSIKKEDIFIIYYGAADETLCAAKITKDEIFSSF